MTGILQIFSLFQAGFALLQLPGVPVDIIPFQQGFAVACTEPGCLCLLSGWEVSATAPLDLSEPVRLASWNGSLAVSDRQRNAVFLLDTLYGLPGSPEGICEVNWTGRGESQLAVCLFNTGRVALLHRSGEVSFLASAGGAKDIAAADADSDGDQDLFVSGCGTGVILLENRESLPVLHEVGNIGVGVKRICTADMDADGYVDVAGIACANGGAGWWRNPGTPEGEWEYMELDDELQGPKDISASGDSLAVVSLFSPVFSTFSDYSMLPAGFTCCLLQHGGALILGHSMGFIAVREGFSENGN